MIWLSPATPFSASIFSFTLVGAPVGLPAVIDASRVISIAGRPTPSVDQFSFPDGGLLPGTLTAGSGFARTSPVLGSNGLGYFVDSDGGITTFSTAAWSTTPIWTGRVPGVGEVIASPSLDCLRTGSGVGLVSSLGVLYVASTNGSLTAVLVDSPRLDDTADWPKYQRDTYNTGNAAVTPNSTCP